MYLDFFGLDEEPFRLTPDPRYFYTSRKHLEALSCLQYLIEYDKGFGVLVGEPGSGKTAVCRVLLEKLSPTTRTALITNTHIDEKELIYMILREFGEDVGFEEKCVLLARLNEFLIQQHSRGGSPVLIIDEAQNLSPRVLEEIRMLANLETERQKLIQIILIGQPSLEEMLKADHLAQLEQRFSVGVRLNRLSLEETREYIRFRMRTAGDKQGRVFKEDAIDVIYEESDGIPRVINNICDACLVNAYALERKCVDSAIARETVEERKDFFEPDLDTVNCFGGRLRNKIKGILPISLNRTERSLAKETAPRLPGISPDSRGARKKSCESGTKNLRITRAFTFPDPDELPRARSSGQRRNLRITAVLDRINMAEKLLIEPEPGGRGRLVGSPGGSQACSPVKVAPCKRTRPNGRRGAIPRERRRAEVRAAQTLTHGVRNTPLITAVVCEDPAELLLSDGDKTPIVRGEDA